MSGHTPAPWIWWTSNSWKRLKRDSRGITQNVLEPYVCRDGHPDLSVSNEDMALIAAAPDLLAELKRLSLAYVGLLESGRDRIISLGGQCDPVDVMEAGDPSLRSAKAAIAKAEGHTP